MTQTRTDAWNFVHANLVSDGFDGAPLGNGDLGALMMANHKQVTFHLAKSDVWDERCDDGTGQRRSFRMVDTFAEMRDMIERQQWSKMERRFEQRNRQSRGTFRLLPAGSLVLDTARFEKEIELLDFGQRLDMQRGTATAACSTRVRRQTTEALVSAEHPVLAVRVRHDLDWRKGDPPRPMTFGMDISLNVKPKDPEARVASGIERGGQARDLLRQFMEVYTSRPGGFHLNFDYAGTGRGTSGPKCFTNETNSGFSAALLEMLLQCHAGVVPVFPAVPVDWREASFQNLRARGAFLVSAVRRGGRVREVRIRSERSGPIALRNPWLRTPRIGCHGRRVPLTARGGVLRWQGRPNAVYGITP